MYVDYFNLDIDLDILEQSCLDAEKFILENFEYQGNMEGQAARTTKLFSQYNFLLLPFPKIDEVYEGIRKSFRSVVPNGAYRIQCWLNVYHRDDYIQWHEHWPAHEGWSDVWHGYLTVAGKDSITSYRRPNVHQLDVKNKPNQLVIGLANGNEHRTYPWKGEGKRITIAFDVVPEKHCDFSTDEHLAVTFNHWLPI